LGQLDCSIVICFIGIRPGKYRSFFFVFTNIICACTGKRGGNFLDIK